MKISDFSINSLLALGAVAVFFLSLGIGSVLITPQEFLNDPTAQIIFLQLRLPRTLLALCVGAGLGAAGALLQGRLQNPLADAGVLGASSAAALGGVLAIHSGLYAFTSFALPICGMLAAWCAAASVFFLAGKRAGVLTVILAGVAIQSLTGALTALSLNLAPSPHAALEIAFWLLGSVADKSFNDIFLILPFLGVGLYATFGCKNALNALSLGEETAQSLGTDLKRLNTLVLLAVTLTVGSVTAIAGSVGFVGLAVPHLLRPLIGAAPGRLLMPSALAGAILVTAADILTRVIPTSSELKLGVVTSLLGAPFFLKILLDYRRKLL